MATPHTTLSERDSKAILAEFGVPIAPERLVADALAAGEAADELGYPVVAKLNGDAIAHKTEPGFGELKVRSQPLCRSGSPAFWTSGVRPSGEKPLRRFRKTRASTSPLSPKRSAPVPNQRPGSSAWLA